MARLGSRAAVAVVALLFGLGWGPGYAAADSGHHGHHGKKHEDPDSIPNNQPHRNEGGWGATFSTSPLGFIDLTGEYFQAQGTNGRSCGSCHIAQDAWAITPRSIQRLFKQTDGTHPIFNPLDANNPATGDFATEHGRRAAYSMMLKHGVFRRGGAPVGTREWDLVAVDDPHGFACLAGAAGCLPTGRLVHWRRAMPTINFRLGSTTINWDGSNSAPSGTPTVPGGLENQARRNVNGAQQGPSLDGVTLLAALPNFPAPIPPFPDPRSAFIPIIADIVGFESSLFTAQLIVPGVGRLDAGGARGGPEALSEIVPPVPLVAGRFDLFDAWQHDRHPRRRQIFRGQELFNNRNGDPVTGPRCGGCHSSPNNGTNVNNTLFNIGTASFDARIAGLTVHTFQRRTPPGAPIETVMLTDAGRGNVTGLWADLGKFKTPTIRGLAARAPYFHNGIAETLEDVVRHYERFLGFNFTHRERDDLVAFLNAL